MSRRADFDVAIAGGGMVGVSLAVALARKAPQARVLLVESAPLPASPGDEVYTPSFDARSTALAFASCLIYRELGLWEALVSHAQPITSIHVSERGRFGSTLLEASEYGWPALGYVVENAWLGRSLIQALNESSVACRSPARVVEATAGAGPVSLLLDGGDRLTADLLVVADGARSSLRDSLGIATRERAYEQQAIIANLHHRRPHQGRAYERFTPCGPLALLPLTSVSPGGHRSALVWTQPQDAAAELLSAREDEFLTRLQAAFGYRLGRFEHVGVRHSYPLTLVEAREQIRRGIVVMGNAAHSLHPVAGQGFNLALRDVARLVDLLGKALSAGEAAGAPELLERYRRAQSADQRITTAFSDRLPDLFMHEGAALGMARDVGLFALDLSPDLKRAFVRRTAGLTPSAGYRDERP